MCNKSGRPYLSKKCNLCTNNSYGDWSCNLVNFANDLRFILNTFHTYNTKTADLNFSKDKLTLLERSPV